MIDDVRDALASAEDFHKPAHATIYQAINSLLDGGGSLDIITLTGKLNDMGVLKQVGGVEYLAYLFDSVPHAASAGVYARRVADLALRRRLIDQYAATTQSLYDTGSETLPLIDSTVSRLIEMRPDDAVSDAHLSHWLDEALEDDRPVIPTGLRSLDDIMGGLEASTFAVIAGRPSMGKTALGVSVALNMSVAGTRVGFSSAEMKGRRIGRRLVCADARISTDQFKRDKHTPAVIDVVNSLRQLPLWIDQTPGAHVDRVCSRARRWKREHGIQVLFVDYLQLLDGQGESQYEKVTYIAQKLQALANELDIAVVALAQVNRATTQKADKRPTMAELKGSGEIEQAADYIMLIHREAYYTKGKPDPNNPLETVRDDEAEIIVEKNRDGETGTAHVGWIGHCGVFASGA